MILIQRLREIFLGLALLVAAASAARGQDPAPVDVCVYGGTSAGVMAAVEAHRLGKSVVLISPSRRLGGLTSNGLGFTDVGNPRILGGLARDYFHRLWLHYQDASAWKWEPRGKFANKGQGGPALNDARQIAISFEPYVALEVFRQYIAENKIPVVYARLDLKNGVAKEGTRLVALRTEDGREFRAAVFIDATYEGDLMAKAGVSYTVGREANAQYGETGNGIQTAQAKKNDLQQGIDPYVTKGNPASGLLPGINATTGGEDGTADKKIQAYCYRLCLTDVAENRVAITRPEGYRESDYELLFRAIELQPKASFLKLSLLENRKTDCNNEGGISTDYIGMNYGYPEADYAGRERIEAAHKNWQLGLMWALQHSPRVPPALHSYYQRWGLAKDEFTETGNWPEEIYVREARRMVSDFVETEPLIRDSAAVTHSIGMGSYTLDSHNVQRYVDATGHVQNEGDVQSRIKGPYRIDYGAVVPKATECENLLVPVCVSASHIAYGSIRMEPVFMILGQSAGAAAALAAEGHSSVQAVDYGKLKERLEADGQVLE